MRAGDGGLDSGASVFLKLGKYAFSDDDRVIDDNTEYEYEY